MAKPKLHIFIPGLPQKDYEYRRGDSILVWADPERGKEIVAVLVDGGEGELFDAMVKEMKRLGIRHVVFILTHWHGDHHNGLRNALQSSWIIVDRIIAPDPKELKLVPDDEGYDEYYGAMKRVQLAKDLNKPIEYPPAGRRVGHWYGKLRVWMWRRKANPGDETDYQVNNTSIQVYFPDLEHLETGDAITSTIQFFDFVDRDKNDWPITSFSINHHGNGVGNRAPLYQKHGAKICWYSDWEPKGVGIGDTHFSKYGAGRCKPLFWCLRPFNNIYVEADGAGHVTWKQADRTYTFNVKYGASSKKEEPKEDPKNSPGENSPKLRDMSTLFGIDVSNPGQGRIDWDKVAPHIDFAILQCGYGQDQTSQDDKQFLRNAMECERLGIPYTVYLYAYAYTAARAAGEADHTLRLLEGRQISMPVYYDIEEDCNRAAAQSIMDAWASKIEKAGYWAGLYTFESFYNGTNLKGCERYTKWIAKYGANNGKQGNPPSVGTFDIWQYASKGVKIPGISSEGLDVNIMYKDLIKEVTGKDYIQAAKDVWAGKYGNNAEREALLKQKGFDPRIVQHFVNRMKA